MKKSWNEADSNQSTESSMAALYHWWLDALILPCYQVQSWQLAGMLC